MTTLIVTAHPDPNSLTVRMAHLLEIALEPGSVEVANLATEGFDPRFTLADRHTYRVGADFAPDVAREQRRLDDATDLVLLFPVYGWSLPAQLKGWIDRVFVNGWAFDVDPYAGIRRNLGRLTIHLLAVAGDEADIYGRHGYRQAIQTQIEHGVIDYCGSRRGAVAFVHESEQADANARMREVAAAVDAVTRSIRGGA